MFKVECPGCKAPYQVDERRVPSTGLKMRCPKCGTTFKVESPAGDARQTGPSPVLGGFDSTSGPPPVPQRARRATHIGVGIGGGVGIKAPPRPQPPTPPPSASDTSSPAAPPGDAGAAALPARRAADELGDLPAPQAPSPFADLPRPVARSVPGDEFDLPMVGQGAGADLPSPAPPRRPPPPRPSAAARQSAITAPRLGLPRGNVPSAPSDDEWALPATKPPSAAERREQPTMPGLRVPAAAAAPELLDALGDMGDLPATRADDLDVDLPSLGGFDDLPIVGGAGRLASSLDSPLPSPVADRGRALTRDDLPSVSGDRPAGGQPHAAHSDLPSLSGDLPSLGGDLPSLGGDLPSLSGDLPSLGGDLPSLSGDLPSLGGDLPSLGGELPSLSGDLPSLSGDLPSLSGDLPSLGGELPSPAGELPLTGGAGRPGPSGVSFSELDLGVVPPAPSFPDLSGELGGPSPSFADDERAPHFAPTGPDPFALPPDPTRRAAEESAPVVRAGGGGVAYGEVNLGGGQDERDVSLDSADDDMEFGAIPQEDQVAAPAKAPVVAVTAPQARHLAMPGVADPPKKSRRGLKVALGLTVVLLLGGGALSLLPDVGPFGAYFIIDQVQRGDNEALIKRTVIASQGELAKDTFASADVALTSVDRQRTVSPRLKELSAYSAFVGFLKVLRFGPDPAVTSRAKVQLEELRGKDDVEYLALARAAGAATEGNLARARQLLGRLTKGGSALDALVTLGEVELLAKDAQAAEAAWAEAGQLEAGARSGYGLARAKLLAGDAVGAEALASKVLEQSPEHVGARVVLARAAWRQNKEEEALRLLEAVEAGSGHASPSERVDAHTLMGDIHLRRSRITHAEKAYEQALAIAPKAAGALAGLGDAFYFSGRYSEALARFKAGVEADPDGVVAAVGMAKTLIALERLEDAKALLTKLDASHAKDARVAFWVARAEDALGNRAEAEAAYKRAIAAAQPEVAVVDAYVGLALLMSQQGRAEEAEQQLAAAQKVLPDSPAIFKALGEVALSQGRYEDAVSQLKKALNLDAKDVGAEFRLGVAYRRGRDFEAARQSFARVAEVDRDYPGLALERGLLFEAAGESSEALREYEAALAKAPTDLDLMLRVGCGKVSAGSGEQAEQILRQVLQQRVNSAETNHCLGRALLLKGNNLAEALKSLSRARDLDPNRAEYHLYVGWAANEAGNHKVAEEALAKSLELDQGLADAYWQRGVLRYRQGAVKDAISDLQRALSLRPSRFEAHAALADSYYDLGRERDALGEWKKAIEADPKNTTWRFRYGKLLAANRQDNEAREQLEKALEGGEQETPKPRWLWEAHRLYAKTLAGRAESVRHWEAFLRDGPRDSPYRAEAKEALKRLGHAWDGP